MAQHDENEMNMIDSYYKRKENMDTSTKPDINDANSDFEEKLRLSMDMMDKATEDSYDFDLNILGIISEGEKVREKKDKKEFIIFSSMVLIIIASLIFITLVVNEKIFIYYQIAAFILIPFCLIPLTYASLKREV